MRRDVFRLGPSDSPVIEALNSRSRKECLSEHWFLSVADARERVELWRQDYNRVRPHSLLENMTPEEFVQQALDAHPHGGGQGSNGTAGRPNDNDSKSASQAEHSHCTWHQDGGKSNQPKHHMRPGSVRGG